MDAKDIITLAISATSAVISVTSVWIALRSMERQRMAQALTSMQSLLVGVTGMLKDDPTLFRLMGIEPDDVLKDDITMSELTFIFLQLNISLGFYSIRKERKIELGRRNFLRNAKARLVWKKYLRNTVFREYGWSYFIDNYIAELENSLSKSTN